MHVDAIFAVVVCLDVQHDCVYVSAVSCGTLVAVPNAYPAAYTSTSYPAEVTYECRSGYWFQRDVTSANLRCDEDGVWRPLDLACRGML